MLDVIFFRTASGNEPVREWLNSIGGDDEKTLSTDIQVAAEHWPQVLRTSLVKKMQGEENLWEVRQRISKGKRTARVLFTVDGSRMILLHGFIKKSQRTPLKDLRLARKRKELAKSERL